MQFTPEEVICEYSQIGMLQKSNFELKPSDDIHAITDPLTTDTQTKHLGLVLVMTVKGLNGRVHVHRQTDRQTQPICIISMLC